MAFFEKIGTWLHGATKVAAVALVAGAGVISTQSADAATTFGKCSADIPDVSTGFVTQTVDCEVIYGTGQSAVNAGDLNTSPGLFSQTSWMSRGKVEAPDPNPTETLNGTNGDLTISGSVLSGKWSVAQSVLNTYQYVALVFKDGNAEPSAAIGYLLGNLNAGNYSSPFCGSATEPCGTNPKDISYVELWVSGEIPLPAAAWLLIAGIGGLGLVARRRKAAA